jgi:S-adenosylmethionine hydrolase
MPSTSTLITDCRSQATYFAVMKSVIKLPPYPNQIQHLPSPIAEEAFQEVTFEFSQERVRIQFNKHDPSEVVESFGSVPPNTCAANSGSCELLELDGSKGDAYSVLGFKRGARRQLTF